MTDKKTKEEIIADILGDSPEDVVIDADFPSRGLFYSPDDPTRPIQIRPMTFDDERAVASLKGKESQKAIDFIISRCLINLSASQLIEMDRLYLLIKIREISYGSEFKAVITCPECMDKQSIGIDISKLNTIKVPENLTNPREITLPICKKKAEVIFPRMADSDFVENIDKAAANMYRFINHIDGYDSKEIISEVTRRLKLRDVHALIEGIGQPNYGIDTQFIYKCDALGCGHESIMEVPFDESFFIMK